MRERETHEKVTTIKQAYYIRQGYLLKPKWSGAEAVAQSVKYLPRIQGSVPRTHKQGIVAHAYDPSNQEVEGGKENQKIKAS